MTTSKEMLRAHRQALADGRAVRVIVTYCDREMAADEWLDTFPTVEAAEAHVADLRARHMTAYRVQVTLERQALDLGLPEIGRAHV